MIFPTLLIYLCAELVVSDQFLLYCVKRNSFLVWLSASAHDRTNPSSTTTNRAYAAVAAPPCA